MKHYTEEVYETLPFLLDLDQLAAQWPAVFEHVNFEAISCEAAEVLARGCFFSEEMRRRLAERATRSVPVTHPRGESTTSVPFREGVG